ncbi:MAG: ligase-associated DNA damage response endonuclease PdeM [Burkholderiaceae bacterium]
MTPPSRSAPRGFGPVSWAGHALVLHPSGAIFLPEQGQRGTVLVADAHFGKALSFRRLGVPVPVGTTEETLCKLDSVLADTGADRLVFLGDFLHSAQVLKSGAAPRDKSAANATLGALHRWRERQSGLQWTLVRGNHDARAGDPPPGLGLEVVNEPLLWPVPTPPLGTVAWPLALCHHPQRLPGLAVLAGHWHPCTVLRGRGRDRLRLPCFWLSGLAGAGEIAPDALGVLPAFGSFTGMHPVAAQSGDRVFAVAGDSVQEVPGAQSA